ncbi:MAG: beta-lactamase family protein [Spirochaetia bacterium]|nr:beta-lactamase family protein [Spirochaetia bacterium]
MRIEKRNVLPLLAFCALQACSGQQKINSTQPPCKAPVPDAYWQVASADSQGFSETRLCESLTAVARSSDNVHSVLVERHGRIVGEVYRTGKDRTLMDSTFWPFATTTAFSEATLHDQRSVTKSIVSLLIGISIDRGQLKTDQLVLDSYPELKELQNGGRETITVKDLLMMSSGLDWAEMGHGPLTSDELPLLWKKDPVAYFFDRKLTSLPGTTFNYAGGSTMSLADLLVRVRKESLQQIAQKELFNPLEIKEVDWATNFRDVPLPHAGLRLKPRDMLKIGRLLNQNGKWNGKQIVSEAWIKTSLAPLIKTNINLMSVGGEDVYYGYQWWTGSMDWHGRKLQWSAGIGNGGQRIFVVPELDLTCVITSGDYGDREIQQTVSKIFFSVLASIKE